jgi:hypothetical protein
MVSPASPANMASPATLVDGVFSQMAHAEIPAEVMRIVERHRQTLLGLAQALIAAGRGEEEVIAVLQSASESFSAKLKSEIERMPS